MLTNSKVQQYTKNTNMYTLFKDYKISQIFELVYDEQTQKAIDTTFNETDPIMKKIKLYYEVINEKIPSIEHLEHGFIHTVFKSVKIEFVQFDKENYFFFLHTVDKVIELLYNMTFPFELLFDDVIPKTYIKIQNIMFDKSRLFRDYYAINKFLLDFHKFEQDIYNQMASKKVKSFNFRKEFYNRLQLNKNTYKYYGLYINGSLYATLNKIYQLINNDIVNNSDSNKHMYIYPSTLMQNDYISKIYTCVWMKNPDEKEKEKVYVKLYVPKYLIKYDEEDQTENNSETNSENK